MSLGPVTSDAGRCRPGHRFDQQREPGVRGHGVELAERPDEPERRGGQAQLVGGQPAQAFPVGGQPEVRALGTNSIASLGRTVGTGLDRIESVEGSQGDRVGGRHHEIRLQLQDQRDSSPAAVIEPPAVARRR